MTVAVAVASDANMPSNETNEHACVNLRRLAVLGEQRGKRGHKYASPESSAARSVGCDQIAKASRAARCRRCLPVGGGD